jgi:hypothetical protein
METKVALPCPQEPTGGPYPNPAESNPHPYSPFMIRFKSTVKFMSESLTFGFKSNKILYAVLIFSMLAKQAAHPLFILSSY